LPEPVLNSLLDDLNTPLAISEIHKMFNSGDISGGNISCEFFGFKLKEKEKENYLRLELVRKIEYFIQKRKEARIKKDFATADKIREDLLLAGIDIKDNSDETSWTKQSNFRIENLEKL